MSARSVARIRSVCSAWSPCHIRTTHGSAMTAAPTRTATAASALVSTTSKPCPWVASATTPTVASTTPTTGRAIASARPRRERPAQRPRSLASSCDQARNAPTATAMTGSRNPR